MRQSSRTRTPQAILRLQSSPPQWVHVTKRQVRKFTRLAPSAAGEAVLKEHADDGHHCQPVCGCVVLELTTPGTRREAINMDIILSGGRPSVPFSPATAAGNNMWGTATPSKCSLACSTIRRRPNRMQEQHAGLRPVIHAPRNIVRCITIRKGGTCSLPFCVRITRQTNCSTEPTHHASLTAQGAHPVTIGSSSGFTLS